MHLSLSLPRHPPSPPPPSHCSVILKVDTSATLENRISDVRASSCAFHVFHEHYESTRTLPTPSPSTVLPYRVTFKFQMTSDPAFSNLQIFG